jgi:transposase
VAIERGEALGSTLRSSLKSARPQRIEVITRGGRRRCSIDQKRKIVAESLAPGAMPSEVIRKHGRACGAEATFARVHVAAASG